MMSLLNKTIGVLAQYQTPSIIADEQREARIFPPLSQEVPGLYPLVTLLCHSIVPTEQ